MQTRALEGFERLFSGVENLTFTDFPDYPNVGDSAIALGHLEFFRTSGIRVDSISAISTLSRSRVSSSSSVLINGGGNIAGLYPVIDDHRYLVAASMQPQATLIQGPQSLHFPKAEDEVGFRNKILGRPNTRIGLRDRESFDLATGFAAEAHLVPDAVHLLGPISSPEADRPMIILARTDHESAAAQRLDRPGTTVDWLEDPMIAAVTRRLRNRTARYLGGRLNPAPEVWKLKAEARLNRGVGILGRGETVITDRLHAMLIALQMGRRVVAIDNNNRKLSKYAETWFGSSQPNVSFANSFSEGRQALGR